MYGAWNGFRCPVDDKESISYRIAKTCIYNRAVCLDHAVGTSLSLRTRIDCISCLLVGSSKNSDDPKSLRVLLSMSILGTMNARQLRAKSSSQVWSVMIAECMALADSVLQSLWCSFFNGTTF